MKEEVLSKRLSLAASFVPVGSIAADVGADHAALSLFLLKKGIAKSVIVSDINPLPLERARLAFRDSEYESRAVFCLADGIRPLLVHHPDCFVVAGMGGETISGMLNLPEEVLKNKTFVFQPMSKIPHLRLFLAEKGFAVRKEQIVWEHKRPFVVMQCIYDGEKRSISSLEALVGAENLQTPLSSEGRSYVEGVYKQLNTKLRGLRLSGEQAFHREELLLEELKQLLQGDCHDQT